MHYSAVSLSTGDQYMAITSDPFMVGGCVGALQVVYLKGEL
jgi:hypothetical protein